MSEMYRQCTRKKQISRRGLIRTAVITGTGLATAAVIACGGQEKPATGPTSVAKAPKQGGTFDHPPPVNGLFREGLDPHILSGAEGGPMNLFYQGLLRMDPGKGEVETIEPSLAQKWETASPTEYIFHIAPGVKWHNRPPVNGRALTADDIVFSLNRIRTDNPRFVNRQLLSAIDRFETVDKATVKVVTKVPDVSTLANLADLTVLVLAPEVVERFERFVGPEQAIGTGAFIITALDENAATTVRNPDYWRPGFPFLDSVRLLNIGEEQAQWAAFLAGHLHIVAIPGIEAKRVRADFGKQWGGGVARTGSVTMLHTNVQKAPFTDPRVTRALRLFVDHQEALTAWSEIFFGAGTSFTFPEALQGWDLSAEEYATKLEWKQPKDDAVREALALLSAAGFTRDRPLRFVQAGDTGRYRESAELMNAQWRRLAQGVVQAELKLFDGPALTRIQRQGDFDVTGPHARAAYHEPDQILTRIYRSRGDVNFGQYSDSRLDEMIDRQRTIFDVQQRKAAIRDIIRYLIDNAPYTNFASNSRWSAWPLKVQDITPETGRPHMWQYEHVWFDT